MSRDDEDAPKKKRKHELGEDLSAFSLDELAERIAVLREEIVRVEAAIAAKRESVRVAASFFRQ